MKKGKVPKRFADISISLAKMKPPKRKPYRTRRKSVQTTKIVRKVIKKALKNH